jgi:hemolysin III
MLSPTPSYRCPISDQTPIEETVNVITHGTGAVLAALGAIFMIAYAWNYGTTLHLLTSTIFGLGWTLLFSCSALYHYTRCLERKFRMRIVDHCAIFIVIAASYGPFMAHLVGGWKGYGMWLLACLVAVAGCLFKWRSENRYGFYSVGAYLVQGWMVMLVAPAIFDGLTSTGLSQLMACGFLISGGTALYNRESIPFHHGIWHMCVLIGAVSLYFCVLGNVLPGPLAH